MKNGRKRPSAHKNVQLDPAYIRLDRVLRCELELLFAAPRDLNVLIRTLEAVFRHVKREGLLSIEPILMRLSDPLLRETLHFLRDGISPEAIRLHFEIKRTEALEAYYSSSLDLVSYRRIVIVTLFASLVVAEGNPSTFRSLADAALADPLPIGRVA